VYGPKHPDERSIFDTPPYILPPGATTPDRWDCDGLFLPADRTIHDGAPPCVGRGQSSSGISGDSSCTTLAGWHIAVPGSMAYLSRARSTGLSQIFVIRNWWRDCRAARIRIAIGMQYKGTVSAPLPAIARPLSGMAQRVARAKRNHSWAAVGRSLLD